MEISSGVCEKVISRIFMTRDFIMCTFDNNFYLISEGATGAQEDSVEILVFTRIVRRRIRADTVELFFRAFQNFCYSTTPAAPFGARMDLGVIRKCELDKILLTLIFH